MKRKRYTIGQLMAMERKWQVKVIRAASKLDEISKRLRRALKANEKTRATTDTMDDVKEAPEPNATVREVDPLGVPCTTCHVGAGADCLSKTSAIIAPHKSRLRDAATSVAW